MESLKTVILHVFNDMDSASYKRLGSADVARSLWQTCDTCEPASLFLCPKTETMLSGDLAEDRQGHHPNHVASEREAPGTVGLAVIV